MITKIMINGKYKFILEASVGFKTVAYMANFDPEFVEKMKYFYPDGRNGSMGPGDRLRARSGARFMVT